MFLKASITSGFVAGLLAIAVVSPHLTQTKEHYVPQDGTSGWLASC